MQRLFGGKINKQTLNKVIGNRKPRHQWLLNCTQAAEALKRMMPYFKNKQSVAELGLELQSTMGTIKKVSEDVVLYILYRGMLRDKIIHLNTLD